MKRIFQNSGKISNRTLKGSNLTVSRAANLTNGSIQSSMKRGQVSVFVIIAIVIVAAVVVFAIFRDKTSGTDDISSKLSPVFDFYLDCIQQETKLAIEVAGTQGGWIESKDYFPGSEYAPFSSHLNFLGEPIPYWFYLSGNGVIRENVPSIPDIENEMGVFIKEGIQNCDFEEFSKKGFEISLGDPTVDVAIGRDNVAVEVVSDLNVVKDEDSGRKRIHEINVKSNFGKFYETALEIYKFEKEEVIFEKYALDVLNLNAPVDGVELQCGPKVWPTNEIVRDIKSGLEQNLRTLKFKGDYYESREDRNYFELDKEVDAAVNVLYLDEWPTRIEIDGEGVEEEFLISKPVGAQEGMGAMGFCYVPYHYVYDLSFPVLIQVYEGDELFQFPMVAIIDNNLPRLGNSGNVPLSEDAEFDLCEFNTQSIELDIFDLNLNSVDANVSFECFDQECRLGESENGKLLARAPACVNGYLVLHSEGFVDKRELFSSNREFFKEILMEREFNVLTEVEVDSEELDGTAIVNFVRDDGYTRSVVLPQVEKVKLTEGNYEIKVYVYGNSSLTIPASSRLECVDVPNGGLLGIFGGSDEECFEISTPESEIDYALLGGGTLSTYFFESELSKGKMKLSVSSLPKPNSLEELSNNFEIFETRRVNVEFG